MASQYIFDPKIYHRGRPRSSHQVGGIEFRYNSAGFRDQERQRVKPKNVFRIALVGDSFVEGYECAFEFTIGPTLQRLLDTAPEISADLRRAGFKAIEVIPFGLGGFCPSFYAPLLDAYCLGYAPDLVYVNVFSFNDVAGLIPFKERVAGGGYRTPFADYYSVRDGSLVLERSMRDEYRRYLRLQAFRNARPVRLLKRLARLGYSKADVSPPDPWTAQYSGVLAKGLFTYFAAEPETLRAYDVCSAFLRRMVESAESAGSRLCVVHLANADRLSLDVAEREVRAWRRHVERQSVHEYDDSIVDWSLPGSKLREASEKLKVPFLDLNDFILAESPAPDWTELFAHRVAGDSDSWIKWGHYTAEGNLRWAKMLEQHLKTVLREHLIRRRAQDADADGYNPYLYPLY